MVLLSEDRRNKSCPPADFIALAKAGQVVNRPITTGTRMGDPRDVWTGRWYTHTLRECTRTDERPNVFYCSADTRIWRGKGGVRYRQTCTIGHSYTVINHRFTLVNALYPLPSQWGRNVGAQTCGQHSHPSCPCTGYDAS